jgi:ABC-type glutathione transport system ATPase component
MIRIENLSVSYEGSQRKIQAVKDVSLDFPKGTVTSLVGESGSGKTTLLMAIPSLLPPEAKITGRISLDGEIITGYSEKKLSFIRWEKIAIVPQGAMNSFTPVIRIGDQIGEVLSWHLKYGPREVRKRTEELLEQAGLSGDFARRYPHELSGGQKQRAAIAMAMACSPGYILADEPTTALDVITQSQIMDTLVECARERSAGLLLVTHDIALASCVSDIIAVMKDGRVVETGSPSSIIEEPRNEHTRLLVESIREIEGVAKR